MKKLIVWAILLLGGGYLGAKLYLHHDVSSELDKMLIMVSPFAKVEYAGVSSTIDGTLSIDGIDATINGYREPIHVERVSLVTPSFLYLLSLSDFGTNMVSNDVPESLGFSVEGFRTSVESEFIDMIFALQREQLAGGKDIDVATECTGKYGYSTESLKRLGYSELVMDIHMGYRMSGDDMVVDVRAGVRDMYDMNLEFTLDGAASPQAMAMGTYRPRLLDGRLEYVDQSLDERTTRLCESAGLSADEVLAAKLDVFTSLGANSGIEFDDQIVEPYKEFLSGKSTFVLTAKPIEPVNLTQIDLYKPSDVPALLNLTAVAR